MALVIWAAAGGGTDQPLHVFVAFAQRHGNVGATSARMCFDVIREVAVGAAPPPISVTNTYADRTRLGAAHPGAIRSVPRCP